MTPPPQTSVAASPASRLPNNIDSLINNILAKATIPIAKPSVPPPPGTVPLPPLSTQQTSLPTTPAATSKDKSDDPFADFDDNLIAAAAATTSAKPAAKALTPAQRYAEQLSQIYGYPRPVFDTAATTAATPVTTNPALTTATTTSPLIKTDENRPALILVSNII